MLRKTFERGVPAALTLALVATFAVSGMASAERVTYPTTDSDSPGNFESSCGTVGGQLIEITGSFGIVLESSCEFEDGSVNGCNWYTDTCYSEWPRTQSPRRHLLDRIPTGGLQNVTEGPRIEFVGGSAVSMAPEQSASEYQAMAGDTTISLGSEAAPEALTPKLDTPIMVPEGEGGVVTTQPVADPSGVPIHVPADENGGIVTTQPVEEPSADVPILVPEGDGGGIVTTQPVPVPADVPIDAPAEDGGEVVTTQPVAAEIDEAPSN